MKKFIIMILDTIFPKKCLVTNTHGAYIGKEIRNKLDCHPPICIVCKGFQEHFCSHIECKEKSYLDGCIICFSNNTALKKLLYKLKYLRRYDVANLLADFLYKHIASHEYLGKFMSSDDHSTAFSSIASHRYRKHFIKGYNQSDILAKKTAGLACLPYLDILIKSKHTKSQVGLTKQERENNLKSAFTVNTRYEDEIKNKKLIILVDDVITTGSSLQYAAKAIKEKYPSLKVWGLVVARNS